MCQMCEESKADLIRMGLAEEANKARAERPAAPLPASRAPERAPASPAADVRR